MKTSIYVDIEFDNATQEVIAIAAIRGLDSKFYRLVKPHSGKIDYMISKLTGITDDMLVNCEHIEGVAEDLREWLGSELHSADFFTYGTNDCKYLRKAAMKCRDSEVRSFLNYLASRLTNVEKKIAKDFRVESIGLPNAYMTMVRGGFKAPLPRNLKFHNPLDDAIALKYVCEHSSPKCADLELFYVPKPNMRYGKKGRGK